MTDPMAYAQAIAALVGVLVLLWIVVFMLKRYTNGGTSGRWGRSKRLGLVEVLPLDGKRRLVLVRRDDQEHLMLIGGERDLVVSTHDAPPEASKPAKKSGRKSAEDDFDAALSSLSASSDKREPSL